MQSDIERKIHGLMSKSAGKGVTEAEAATYAAHAAKLCLQYNIDQNKIKIDQGQELKVIHIAVGGAFATHPKHHVYLRNAAISLFSLIGYSGQRRLESGARVTQHFFIGLETNAEAGAMTFQYFDELIEALLSQRKVQGIITGGSQSNSYRKGASGRLYDLCQQAAATMLHEAQEVHNGVETLPGSTAMVRISDQLVQQEAKRFGLKGVGRSITIKATNKDATVLGYVDASKINIHGATAKRISG